MMSTPRPTNTPASTSTTTPAATANKKDRKDSLIKTINNKEEFKHYLGTTVDKYVLVEFYAAWCGPCKMLAMKFQEIAEKYQDKVVVLKVNVEDLEELAIEYEVKIMPSFIIVKNGKKLEQFSGSKPEQLDNVVKKYFCKPI